MKYNLSTICRTANGFRKAGYSRSAAFVLAWRLAKETACTNVAGTRFAYRQDVLAALAKADPKSVTVELARESENLFDSCAVVVIARIGGQAHKLGYLPAAAAALIAPLMDAGQTVTAALNRIVGGWAEGISYGAQIKLAM